jgi:hypothetical protein
MFERRARIASPCLDPVTLGGAPARSPRRGDHVVPTGCAHGAVRGAGAPQASAPRGEIAR